MIDVSQSVEHEHPQALEFLRKDCTNVVDFFRKHLGPTQVFTVRELFEFVVKEKSVLQTELGQVIEDNDVLLELYLFQAHSNIKQRPIPTPQTEIDDEVFKQVYIPISFTEIVDVEAQLRKMDNWDARDSEAYKSIIKMEPVPVLEVEESSSCAPSDSEEDDISSDSDASYNFVEREPKGKKYEDKESKKERKQAVKDDKSEKRKIKMPKSVKKRKLKVAAEKKKK